MSGLFLPLRYRLRKGQLKTAWIVASSHVFVAAATLLQSVLLARLLSLHDFGTLAVAIAVAGVTEAMINARGSETALAAFADARHRSQDAQLRLTRKLFRLDFAWSTAAYLLCAAIVSIAVSSSTLRNLLFGLIIAGWISFPWGTVKAFITIHLSSRKFSVVEVSFAGTVLTLGISLTLLVGSIGFVIGMIVASGLRTIIGLGIIGLGPVSMFRGPHDASAFSAKTLAWFGATGTIRSFLINGLQQVDVIVLAAFVSPGAVGLYRAAKTVSTIPQRLGQPVWVLLKRAIIHGMPVGIPRGTDPIVAVAALMLMIGVTVMPFIILYSDQAMALLFGPEFAPAGVLLWWLLPAAWIMSGATGWSATFGSISKRRLAVILIYLSQVAVIVATLATMGVAPKTMATAFALSQFAAAAGFWVLYFRNSRSEQSTRTLKRKDESGSM